MIPKEYYSENGDDGSTEKEVDLPIARALEIVPELKEEYNKNTLWFDTAMKLENIVKANSTHAAGVLISSIPLKEYIPIVKSSRDYISKSALNLSDSEYCKAIKFDFLGNATLGVIDKTLDDLKLKVDLNDSKFFENDSVWDIIGSEYTTTLFQIGSYTYKSRMGKLKPRTIQELANCLALIRGPCLSAKLDKDYISILHGEKKIENLHPYYDDVTRYTNGILLFQEDIIKILINWGFEYEDAFKIMKASAKKKFDKLVSYKKKFDELSIEKNISVDASEKVWKRIYDMGKYSFGKGHAISYSVFCYLSAYLKTYYPLQWMANAITNVYELKKDDEIIIETIEEAKRIGVEFLPLNINKSNWIFKVEDNKIRIGFVGVKGIGNIAFECLNSLRSSLALSSVSSVQDLVNKKYGKFDKRAQIASIFAGALDEISNKDRISLYYELCDIRKEDPKREIKISEKVIFNSDDDISFIESCLFGGVSILNDISDKLKLIDIKNIEIGSVVQGDFIVTKIKPWTDKKGRKMGFVTLKNKLGKIDCVVFADKFSMYEKQLIEGNIIELTGKKSKENSILLESILAATS